MAFHTRTSGASLAERLRIDSSGVLNVPGGIGTQLRFENQHSVTADAAISTFDDASGTLLCLGSNFYINSSGSETRYNTSEESTGIILNRQGYINFNTGGTGATAVNRIQITETGKVQIGLPGATASLPGGVEVVNIRAASNANLIVRNIGSLTSSPAGAGVGIDILNDGSNTVMDMCLRGHTVIFRNRTDETLRIDDGGRLLIGTTAHNTFNGVGGHSNLIVAGSTADTDITDNSDASLTISNKDGTANNTAGLHFAREDTDGTPHYSGASIVAQFTETMNTGQYPKADLAFLTSTANNNAPSEKMRLYAAGGLGFQTFEPDGTITTTLSSNSSSGNYTTIIPLNTSGIGHLHVYLVSIHWSFNSNGAAPYYCSGAVLWQTPHSNNSNGVNEPIKMLSSCHIGGNYHLMIRNITGSSAYPGLQAANMNWTAQSGSHYIVKYKRIY